MSALEEKNKNLLPVAREEPETGLSTGESLSPAEAKFCDLYCNGGKEYIGKGGKCFIEAFGVERTLHSAHLSAKRLLKKQHVIERIKELVNLTTEENLAMKKRLTESLFSILEETRDALYKDRRGTLLSPAPLRAVAVNAAKAIADLNNIGGTSEAKFTIDASNGGGVTFNVVVPQPVLQANTGEHED